MKWTQVPELVERRRVFLKEGYAYVPMRDQTSLIMNSFSSQLTQALEVRIIVKMVLELTLFSTQLKHSHVSTKIADFYQFCLTSLCHSSLVYHPKPSTLQHIAQIGRYQQNLSIYSQRSISQCVCVIFMATSNQITI